MKRNDSDGPLWNRLIPAACPWKAKLLTKYQTVLNFELVHVLGAVLRPILGGKHWAENFIIP